MGCRNKQLLLHLSVVSPGNSDVVENFRWIQAKPAWCMKGIQFKLNHQCQPNSKCAISGNQRSALPLSDLLEPLRPKCVLRIDVQSFALAASILGGELHGANEDNG